VKNKLILLSLILAIAFAPKAFAQTEETEDTFKWYTSNYGDDTQRDTFFFGETPYLYVHLPYSLDYTRIRSWWFSDESPLDSRPAVIADNSGAVDFWTEMPSSNIIMLMALNSDSINATEDDEWWTVMGDVCDSDNNECINCASTRFKFTAVPEPISSALFLLGGAGIAAIRVRRNKKNKA
jgi:hypothetical protein